MLLVPAERDPDESTNQYANPKYASVIAELKEEVDKLRSHDADNTDISVMPAEWKKFRHK